MTTAQIQPLIDSLKQIAQDKVIVKIDGRGGSGKSTLAKLLANELNALHLNLDEYTTDKTDLFDQRNIDLDFEINFQNKKYDEQAVSKIIEDTGKKYIFLEGCFSFKNLAEIDADYLIWVEVDRAEAGNRLNSREKLDSGRPHISHETIELSTTKWQESEDKYIAEFSPQTRADYIFDNNYLA